MNSSHVGLRGATVMFISMFSGLLAGAVSWMDAHQWAAIVVGSIGAALVTVSGNVVYRTLNNPYRERALKAEGELHAMARAKAASAK